MSPRLDGVIRRSYVLWREYITPTIALEFASGDGSEERDRTPLSRAETGEVTKPGKFWVYEQVMRIPYYGIYLVSDGVLEMYHLVNTHYEKSFWIVLNSCHVSPSIRMGSVLGTWAYLQGYHVCIDC